MGNDNAKLFVLFFIALVIRIPFLFAGYGVEEDSWGHVLNAALMFEEGNYEISRLPGHPIFEALLLILWKIHAPWLFNLPAVLAGAGSTVVFYRLIKPHSSKLAFWWAIAFSAVPVFYISSTYTIDYAIALFFVLLSFESLKSRNYEKAGVWLAISTGLRITSLGFLLPFFYFIYKDKKGQKSLALRIRSAAKVAVISVFVSLIFYIPAMANHGLAFFNFHKPPYPNWIEVIYKMLIGPWGLLGLIAVAGATLVLLFKKEVLKFSNKEFVFLFLIYLVFAIAYFRMPEKAAFWLPVVPFTLLFFAKYLPLTASRVVIALLIFSPFFLGINKADPYTGSKKSPLAVTFDSSNGMLFLDPIQGPIFNDFTKRENKLQAVEQIEHNMMLLQNPSVIIAGWWYAMIEVDRRDGKWSNQNIQTVYYASPEELAKWKDKGYELRYLPDQEKVNDTKYKTTYTVKHATLLPIE